LLRFFSFVIPFSLCEAKLAKQSLRSKTCEAKIALQRATVHGNFFVDIYIIAFFWWNNHESGK
jgi:hypothetical protein